MSWGVPLFTLTQAGLALIDYGQLLRSRADEYLRQHHRVLNEIRQLREASDNVLTIGIRAGFSEGMGKDFLLNFILENPDLVVQVRSFSHDRMEEGMRQTDIPVWVAPGGYDESRFIPLYEHTEKLFLLVSEDHPLARRQTVRVEGLDGYPLISLPHNIGQQPAVDWAVNRRCRRCRIFCWTPPTGLSSCGWCRPARRPSASTPAGTTRNTRASGGSTRWIWT